MSNGYYADLPLRDKNIECSIRYLSKTTKLGMWSILYYRYWPLEQQSEFDFNIRSIPFDDILLVIYF
jgi:hypothetical protein